MRYLGGLRGTGRLTCGGKAGGRADYEIDVFLTAPSQVSASGEIRLAPKVLKRVFGRTDLHLLTGDGRDLSLAFSDKELGAGEDAAHVDVAGELPGASEWRDGGLSPGREARPGLD